MKEKGLPKVIGRGMIIHRIFNLSLQGNRSMAKRKIKRKVKRKRRKTPNRYKPLVSKLQSKGLLDKYNVEVRYEPSGVAKMSEVVIDFIEPYAEYAETYEAYQKLVIVAIVAWNTTLLPKKKQKAMVKKMIKSLSLLLMA